MTAVIQEFNSELARLSKQVHASLVRVESGRWGAGAGTIWHSEGLILTNSHVARSRRLSVTCPMAGEPQRVSWLAVVISIWRR